MFRLARRSTTQHARWTLLPLIAFCLAAPLTLRPVAAAPRPSLKVALVHISGLHGDEALAALADQLKAGRVLTPVAGESIRRALQEEGLSAPLTIEQAVALGKRLQVDWVLQGSITQGGANKGKGGAFVDMTTESYLVSTGETVSRTAARGTSPLAANGQSANGEAQTPALRDALSQTAQQMGEAALFRNNVISKPAGGQARIGAGILDGVRAGAEVAFVENGERIGTGKVIEVEPGDSLVAVRGDLHQRLGLGTGVRLIYNPSGPFAGKTGPQLRVLEERQADIDFVAGLLIAAGIVAAFAK